MFAQQTTPHIHISRFIAPSMLTLAGFTLALVAAGCSGEATSATGSAVSTGTPGGDGTGTNGTGTPSGSAANGTGSLGTTDGTVAGSSTDVTGFSEPPPPSMMGDQACIQEGVTINTLTPTVDLLIDRSGSMNADFGALDRWNTIRNVLVDSTAGFVMRMQDKVRFGLTLYTGYLLGDDDPMGAATCPDLIEQPVMINNFMPIQSTFMANGIGGSTPSAESIAASTAKLEAVTEVGPKVLVFATDGDPDTCANPGANGTDPPRMASEMAVQAAWTKGITTYVIAVGNDIQDLQHMTNLAKIGQGGDPAATYFQASDSAALEAVFNTILRGVISCDFMLNGTVSDYAAPSGTVKIDTQELVYGDPNGWVLVNGNTVRLQGDACNTLKIEVSFVDITFPCGTVMIF